MHEIESQNKQAWDTLYHFQEQPVWGREAVGFLKPMLDSLSLSDSPHILDAATGEGRNLPLLLRLGGTVVACDSSENALSKIALPPEAPLERIQCDLGSTPFHEAAFDLILLSDVIETLPDPRPILREMVRVLKKGGLLLCNIPGEDDGIYGQEMVPMGEAFLYRESFFFRFLEEAEAVLLLQEAGLEIMRHELHSWVESPHPGFRQENHRHVSRVFLTRKP